MKRLRTLTVLSSWALTYYVYDNLGNLRCVLQPELSKIVHQNDSYVPTASDLNAFAFQYRYDYRNRMSEKKFLDRTGSTWSITIGMNLSLLRTETNAPAQHSTGPLQNIMVSVARILTGIKRHYHCAEPNSHATSRKYFLCQALDKSI